MKGKKVLHLDRNGYYGAETASLSLTNLYEKYRGDEKPTASLGHSASDHTLFTGERGRCRRWICCVMQWVKRNISTDHTLRRSNSVQERGVARKCSRAVLHETSNRIGCSDAVVANIEIVDREPAIDATEDAELAGWEPATRRPRRRMGAQPFS